MSEQPHLPCPYVDCGSSDAFSWNDDGYGKCHACHQGYPSKKKMFDWAKEEYPVEDKIDLKKWRPNLKGVKKTSYDVRGISERVCKLFKIQSQFDSDGEWLQDAFAYPSNVKYRSPTPEGEAKTCIWKETGQGANELFGPLWTPGASKRLYITEGEYDAASLYEILGETWPVKSLPSSSIGANFLKANHDELKAYEFIVYAGELDDPGRKAADLLYSAYPDKLMYFPMTKHKDANAYLNSDDVTELKWSALKPQKYAPPNFFTGDDEWLHALRHEKPYTTYRIGHSQFDAKTRGLVKGGLTLIKAPRGSGKTSFFRYMQNKLRVLHPEVPYALLHMEEMLSSTIRNMASYRLGVNVNTEEDQEANGISMEELERVALELKGDDKIIPFELLPTDEPLDIVGYVRLAATVFGAEFVFIDHMQRLVYRSGLANATENLTQVATQLAELGKELNIGVIAISHVNTNGVSQYAAAMENEAIIVIDVVRDMTSEDEVEQNTSEFDITKNRPFSKLGSAGRVWFNPETALLEETV